MSNEYYDEEDMNETFHLLCECGHELYRHAHTMQYNYTTGQQYFRVSQCTGPDEIGNKNFCECREFRRAMTR